MKFYAFLVSRQKYENYSENHIVIQIHNLKITFNTAPGVLLEGALFFELLLTGKTRPRQNAKR